MKIIRSVQTIVCFAMIAIWAFLLFGFFAVPSEIVAVTDAVPTHRGIYTMVDVVKQIDTLGQKDDSENYDVTVKLLGAIPVKNTTVKVNRRQYVVVSGEVFGLRMYTSGVMIVSTDRVETPQGSISPADRAGLKKGDIILEVNGSAVNSHSELSELLSGFNGEPFTITYERSGTRRTTTFVPTYSADKQKYMAGMWVRDSAAGIGTMTFYDPSSHIFAGLGHAVCDLETGEILTLNNGDIVKTDITGCLKGSSGRAGELYGTFRTQSIGSLICNDAQGVYGLLTGEMPNMQSVPVATQSEVHTGGAQILSTIDDTGPQLFDVEIEKISAQDDQDRNMVIQITDQRLLDKTGGIVQGMSGSPVLQDSMLVGAVTHVFVNEPKRGYAIFSANMMEKVKNIAQAAESLAS